MGTSGSKTPKTNSNNVKRSSLTSATASASTSVSRPTQDSSDPLRRVLIPEPSQSRVTETKGDTYVDLTDPLLTQVQSSQAQVQTSVQSSTSVQSEPRLNMSELKKSSDMNDRRKQSSINCKSAFQALNLEEVPYWKNQCKVDINRVNYVWIYSAYTGNGWWYVSPQTNEHIEKLYQLWVQQQDISMYNHLSLNGGDFKYNFEKMCQINRYTKTNRTIRRLDINQLNDIEKKCEDQLAKSDYLWTFQAGHKQVPYMPNYQEEIEAGFQDFNERRGDYVHHRFKYSNGYNYQINYQKMTQLNQDTGVRRAIIRVQKTQVETSPEYEKSCGFENTDTQVQPSVDTQLNQMLVGWPAGAPAPVLDNVQSSSKEEVHSVTSSNDEVSSSNNEIASSNNETLSQVSVVSDSSSSDFLQGIVNSQFGDECKTISMNSINEQSNNIIIDKQEQVVAQEQTPFVVQEQIPVFTQEQEQMLTQKQYPFAVQEHVFTYEEQEQYPFAVQVQVQEQAFTHEEEQMLTRKQEPVLEQVTIHEPALEQVIVQEPALELVTAQEQVTAQVQEQESVSVQQSFAEVEPNPIATTNENEIVKTIEPFANKLYNWFLDRQKPDVSQNESQQKQQEDFDRSL